MQTVYQLLIHGLSTSPATWIGMVLILGLAIGSFLNVVIHRVPIMLERAWRAEAKQLLDETAGTADAAAQARTEPPARYNLFAPRSACPNCGAMITAAQNIPLISYLMLGGKCAKCGAKISVRYPVVELTTAILSALVAWKFGFVWYTAAALLLTWFLIALFAIDFDTQLLPDNLTLPLLWIGLLLSLAGTIPDIGLPVDTRSSLLGAAAGYLSLWTVYQLFKLLTGKEGMGYGDFKLFAALGAWLGWQMLLPIILLSALAGSIFGGLMILVRGRDHNMPFSFGPYLATAGWIALMWGKELVGSYLRMTGLA